MALGQSFFFTTLTLNLTRRATFCFQRISGKPPLEAQLIADEVGLSAAGTVAAITGVATADPLGASLSASYLALEAGEAQKRNGRTGR